MNVNCIICSDILLPTAEIYTTNCGHLFHYTCLIQWIERSCTCPQCRCKVTEKTIHRIYFNLANADGITDDVVTLQYKMDNLDYQIKLKNKDIQICNENNKKLKDQRAALRNEVKDLNNKQNVSESVIHALKEQVSYFKLKAKETSRLNDEIIRLKDKVNELKHVELVIAGSKEQVNDMLRYNKDVHSLSLLVYTLKKELLQADRKYKLLNSNIKHLESDIYRYRNENIEIMRENSNLKNEIEVHQHCESEKQHLKTKIIQMEKKIVEINTANDGLNEISMNSPCADRRACIALEITSQTPLTQKIQSIVNSESPYLPIKSSNVGLPCLLNPKFISSSYQRSSSEYVFKNPTAVENMKINRKEYNYNGLGGHSKEEIFPIPKPVVGIKRSKSATSSSKFRKLAPNKKIVTFCTQEL